MHTVSIIQWAQQLIKRNFRPEIILAAPLPYPICRTTKAHLQLIKQRAWPGVVMLSISAFA
jgi:hypothetical protein